MSVRAVAISESPVQFSKPVAPAMARRFAWVAYLVVGITLVALHYGSSGTVSAWSYLAVSGLPVAALFLGPRLMGATVRWPWYLLGAGQLAFAMGDALWLRSSHGLGADFPSAADLAYLAAYPLLAAGLTGLVWIRLATQRATRLFEPALIVIAGATLLWVVNVAPFIDTINLSGAAKMTLVAYLAGDVALIASGGYLFMLGNSWRQAAHWLIIGAAAMLVLADMLYARTIAAGGIGRSLPDGLWLGSYVAFGMAALVPSMRSITKPMAAARQRPARQWPLVVAALVMVPCTAVGEQLVVGRVHPELLVLVSVAVAGLMLGHIRGVRRAGIDQEFRYAALLSRASEAFVITSLDGRLIYSSGEAERMVGRQPGEFADQTLDKLLDVVHPDDLPTAYASLAKVQGDPLGIATVDLRILHADGSQRWMRFTAANRQEDPAIAGIVIKYHDVTDEHAAAAHLSRLSTAVDQSSEAVVVASPTGDIEYVNKAFERASGYSADEVVGHNPRLLQSGQHSEAFYASMWSSLSAGLPWTADFTNRRKDGSIYESATVISPIHDDAGTISGYVSVSRDVTAERRNEQRSMEIGRERALIADTIRSIDTRAAPEEMAQAVCHQVASLSGVLTSGLFIFEAGGEAAPYGFVAANDPHPPLMRLSRERTKYLIQQATRGPWIEIWQGWDNHPYNDLLGEYGVRAIAFAPVRDGKDVIGFLNITAGEGAEKSLSATLPSLVEFADLVGTLIGPRVAARTLSSAARMRLQRVIDDQQFWVAFQPIVDTELGRTVGYEALARFRGSTAAGRRFSPRPLSLAWRPSWRWR